MENSKQKINNLENQLKLNIEKQHKDFLLNGMNHEEKEMANIFFDFLADMLYSRGVQEKTMTLLKISKNEEMNLFDYLIDEMDIFTTDRDFNSYWVIEDYFDTILEQKDCVKLYNETLQEVKKIYE